MPFVSAMLCAKPSSSLTARAVLALTDLTEKVLGKERERVTVDKARYVRDVNRALQSLLGGSSGYVVVAEVAPDAWGYAGETQELRYARNRLLV